jgi:5'-AMP-activated protein kinase beta subunit, interaction domain
MKPTSLPAAPTPKHIPGQSFWSTSSSVGNGSVSEPTTSGDHRSALWTSVFPPELLAAAKEEESYLANSSSSSSTHQGFVPAPNIPPAPGLPRHLDKLILNVRPGAGSATGSSGVGSSSRSRDRDRDRDDRRTGRKGRSLLGLTSHIPPSPTSAPSPEPRIPVTTASGTDITTSNFPRTRLDVGPGLSDDASVLPIPSHVVLHHLSTSAIRNGVLAVGNTTRYRKKVRSDHFVFISRELIFC